MLHKGTIAFLFLEEFWFWWQRPTELVSPSTVASSEAFGSTTLIVGPVTLTPSGISSAEVFGSTTVVSGAVSVVPDSIASAELFGTATVELAGLPIPPFRLGEWGGRSIRVNEFGNRHVPKSSGPRRGQLRKAK